MTSGKAITAPDVKRPMFGYCVINPRFLTYVIVSKTRRTHDYRIETLDCINVRGNKNFV